ncbi:SIMPL domain-containing protein [Borreliella turdi]|uniref:SIMPL domain-containing protein n=1 Tax=Borreliella turdi TaxID=57863 RepID=UPI001F40559E|nr:SIMPL domain-containing protein [Borreliella turdi]
MNLMSGVIKMLHRYSVYISLIVNTIDFEKMKAVGKNIVIKLYNQQLLISNNVGLRYFFDKINDIKSEMLKIKNANQEYFKFFSVDISFDNQKLYPQKIIKDCCNYFLLFRLICIKEN